MAGVLKTDVCKNVLKFVFFNAELFIVKIQKIDMRDISIPIMCILWISLAKRILTA